ncbi:MAG: PocR ligand-binding domain-containing protein [Spirochaetales bacterium]|nr:PocR ligand-binding domain-containing protein [Spirochaetales bacterium]
MAVPEEGGEIEKPLSFSQIIDLDEIQKLQDQLSYAANVASIIIDKDGTALTKPSNYSRLCKLITGTKEGAARCLHMEEELADQTEKDYILCLCPHTGLLNGGVKVFLEGEVIAYWLMGQIQSGNPPDEPIEQYAQKLGLPADELKNAYEEIPFLDKEGALRLLDMLRVLSNQMVNISYQGRLKQLRLNEQEKTTQKILQNETFFRTLISTIPDLLWIKDREGKYMYCNPPFEGFFGSTSADMLGKTDYDFVNKELADFFRERDRIAIKNNRPTRNEELLTYASDGSNHFVETLKTPVFDENSELIGVLGIGRDITRLRDVEKELNNQNARWESFLESADNIMGIMDKNGRVITLNKGALDYFPHRTHEDVIGRDLNDLSLFLQDEDGIAKKLFHSVWETGRPQATEAHFLLNNRTLWLNIRFFRTGEDIGFVVEDITEKKSLQSQLLQAQKLDSIGRLAGGVAHDFNNNLDVIVGYTDLLLNAIGEDREALSYLEEIKKASRKSAKLIRQLLTFARKGEIDPCIIDLNDIIDGMLSMLGNLLEKSIKLNWLPGEAIYPVRIDPFQMDQVVANLCINARDAMDSVGTITMWTENQTVREQELLLPGCPPGLYAVLIVKDSGKGMDKETQSKIFEPFFTTKAVGKGTGLGLSTVYGIMKQNGGCIQVESAPGEGTTMKLYFPRAEEKSDYRSALKRASESVSFP